VIWLNNKLNQVYKALADPTRRKILELLREQDLSAGELAEHFPQAKPTLSRHFSVLKEADLIEGTRDGTTINYRLNVTLLEEAMWGLMKTFDLNAENSEPTRKGKRK